MDKSKNSGGEVADIFKPSRKTLRSPRLLISKPTNSEYGTPKGLPVAPVSNEKEEKDVETPKTGLPEMTEKSPREELIFQEREEEEKSLKRCREVLDRMYAALNKQINISMDVKKGVSELSELLDVVQSHRNTWKLAEKEQKAQKIREKIISGHKDTPLNTKRPASSPVEVEERKRHKAEDGIKKGEWQTVKRRKPRKPKADKQPKQRVPVNPTVKTRSDAVIIKPREGHSYAEVLQNLRNKVKPEEADVSIQTIRRTKEGSLLLQLTKGGKINDKFSEAIKSTLVDTADIREVKPKTTLEIRDLDSFTTEDEVKAAIKSLLNNPLADFIVRVGAPNFRELKRATLTLSSDDANFLLKKERVKIGWLSCKIRLCNNTKRCFKCWRFGHLKFECEGPDRTNMCIKCGQPGHKIAECQNKAKCCLCAEKGLKDLDHKPGTFRCADNKKSLQ